MFKATRKRFDEDSNLRGNLNLTLIHLSFLILPRISFPVAGSHWLYRLTDHHRPVFQPPPNPRLGLWQPLRFCYKGKSSLVTPHVQRSPSPPPPRHNNQPPYVPSSKAGEHEGPTTVPFLLTSRRHRLVRTNLSHYSTLVPVAQPI